MKNVYIISRIFDPADTGISKLRDALHAAGFSSILIADRSIFGDIPKDIIVLRNRALAVLMFGSQIVMAAIILGYFTRFFPSIMTVLFWSLVLVSVFIASRYGKRLRDRILEIIGSVLARIIFAQKKPGAIWLIEPDPITSADVRVPDQETVLVADFQTRSEETLGNTDPDVRSMSDLRWFQNADMILIDHRSKPALESENSQEPGQYFSDLDAIIDELTRRVK